MVVYTKIRALFRKEFLLAILSGILIFLSFPNYNLYGLEWISFVPLLLSLENATLKKAFALGVLCGVTTLLGGFSWISDMMRDFAEVPFPFYYLAPVGYSLVFSLGFASITTLFQWARRFQKIPEILLFPFVFIAIWSFFPILFQFHLADGQSKFLIAIQAIEFTGITGLDFILLLVNMIVFQLLTWRRKPASISLLVLGGICVVSWFGYGVYSLEKWDKKIAQWEKKKIGITQPNRPPVTGVVQPDPSWINPWELSKTRELAEKGAKIVIWPEGFFFGYYQAPHVKAAFHAIAKHYKVAIAFLDTTKIEKKNKKFFYNSAILINEKGKFAGMSHKRILVPFGEYIPFIEYLEYFGVPNNSLNAGKKTNILNANGIRMVPIICYESIFSDYVASTIGKDGKGKLLVTFTQDGWYGDSLQQVSQHSAITNMRAVENRVPLIHVINNGPSYVIMPNGRQVFTTPHLKRGAWLAEVPYNKESGGSFFSKYPNLFIGSIRIITFLGISFLLIRRKKLIIKQNFAQNKVA
ncbi:MAG: apolipoprotein N-acyltransferase [bacterium]|jgi:apolipoprotein N-acyltransferase